MNREYYERINHLPQEDLDILIDILPERVKDYLIKSEKKYDLVEVILDLGRLPEVRFSSSTELIAGDDITHIDIQYLISKISEFGDDNRDGIERTLHRISVIRNRKGTPVGITCRVGRAIEGTIKNIEDLVLSGESVLLLGKPGVGKTTMLREVARVLSVNANKRVVIVDTSNEIAGDGDVAHTAIGNSRRMQVPSTTMQHQIMIEAVENHMPEVIIIDEMSTEHESLAARTIAERGVQLIATAHANNLENVLTNPTLSDLVGGTQTVTLGDIEAKKRKTQKTILERKHDPTFTIVVEIVDRNTVSVHKNVARRIDDILRGRKVSGEKRWIEDGEVKVKLPEIIKDVHKSARPTTILYPFGISKTPLETLIKETNADVKVTSDESKANIFVTTKSHYSRKPKSLSNALNLGIPVHVLKRNSKEQVKRFLEKFSGKIKENYNESINGNYSAFSHNTEVTIALEELKFAVQKLNDGENRIELNAQNSFIRRLQHKAAAKEGINSVSVGEGQYRRVVLEKVW